jgi:hypothetical protein
MPACMLGSDNAISPVQFHGRVKTTPTSSKWKLAVRHSACIYAGERDTGYHCLGGVLDWYESESLTLNSTAKVWPRRVQFRAFIVPSHVLLPSSGVPHLRDSPLNIFKVRREDTRYWLSIVKPNTGRIEAIHLSGIKILRTNDIPETGFNGQRVKISNDDYRKLCNYLIDNSLREMGMHN